MAVGGDDQNGSDTWLTLADLQAAETKLLDAIDLVAFDPKLKSRANNCAALNGWVVNVHSSNRWRYPGIDYEVSGLTWCLMKTSTIDTPQNEVSWQRSSLAHELVHAAQRCEDREHINWAKYQLFQAIDMAVSR
jgi:hypothetical protein